MPRLQEEIELQKDKPATTRRTITLQKTTLRAGLWILSNKPAHLSATILLTPPKKLIETIIGSGIQVDTAYAIDYKRT